MELTLIKGLLKDFYLLSGIRVSLYNTQLQCIADCGAPPVPFCTAIQRKGEGYAVCFRSDLSAFERVKTSREPLYFDCPFGIPEALVPIVESGTVRGYLFAGQVLRKGKEHEGAALRTALSLLGEERRDEIGEAVSALCRKEEDELLAARRLLGLLATHIAERFLLPEEGEHLAALTKEWLDRNFAHRVSLSSLSLHFHCSTVTLTEHFRKRYGDTIFHYLTERRLCAARRLLCETSLPTGVIAEQCGFSCSEHFSKVFKRQCGIPPSVWRDTRCKSHGIG